MLNTPYVDDVFVDIGDSDELGMVFVALTRVKRFEQLYIFPFDFSQYEKIGLGKYVSDRTVALGIF